jgi:hypothetical protein
VWLRLLFFEPCFLPPNPPKGGLIPIFTLLLGKKISPPFEGGVAGTIDYLIFTGLFPGQGG